MINEVMWYGVSTERFKIKKDSNLIPLHTEMENMKAVLLEIVLGLMFSSSLHTDSVTWTVLAYQLRSLGYLH